MKLLFLLFSGLKWLKFGKLLTTGGTMLISVITYAFFFGWWYAVGFVALLFCHEMGHYIAARQRGLPVGAPTFIPFLGAWIEMKKMPHNAEVDAYVGIAGPLAGTLAAIACYFWARSSGSNLLLAVSYSGFFLNLFNLIPLMPFDGGRVTAVISPRLWLLGVPILIGLFIWRPSPMLILVAIMAAPHVLSVWRGRHEQSAEYYDIPFGKRLEYGLLYVGLIAYLAIMSHDVHEMLGSRMGG